MHRVTQRVALVSFLLPPPLPPPYQLWKPGVTLTPYGHMIAGAAAGVAEHCCMYPFDTLKTRLQVSLPLSPTYRNVAHAAQHAIAKEGLLSLYSTP